MMQEEENKPTTVRSAPGANSASSGGPGFGASQTPFDERLRAAQSGSGLPPMPTSLPPVEPPTRWSDGRFDAGPSTTVIQREPEIDSVAMTYCRKGLRKGQLTLLQRQRSEFGRATDCDLPIEDSAASAHHGAILFEDGAWQIFDFASTNGTFVNGERLGKQAANPLALQDGDIVCVGETELVFKKID